MEQIFIIAGEPSGDILGAKLISALKKQSAQEIEFIGVGGKNMQKEGLKSFFDISELSLMGIAEVIPHIPRLLKRINQTANNIVASDAKIVITIDAPDFCFRVIKKLNKISDKDIKKIHLIAPSVWAYREKRAKKIAKLYDLLLAILPFEPPYFEKYGLKTEFIGHPITENYQEINDNDFRQKNNIKNDDLLICAMAGSRKSEIKIILPEIIGAVNILAKKYPNLVVAMPVIDKSADLINEQIKLFNSKVILVKEDQKQKLFAGANLAIAKSGTNNLEIALAKLPMITIYKFGFITYLFAKMLIKIKFCNIINIILNKELITELIQNDCNSKKIAEIAEKLISNPKLRQNQIDESQNILKILGLNSSQNPSYKAAQKILSLLAKNY